MKNKVMCLILLILIFLINVNVSAKTLGEFKKELSDTEEKLEKNQLDKAKTEEEIEATKEKIADLSKEKIKTSEEIEKLNEDLKQLALDIEKMQKELKSIINYYQLSNTTSLYMEYVFNAESMTDFIYRLAISEQLSRHRKNTIDKYNKLIEETKNKVAELSKKQIELNKLEEQLAKEMSRLGENLSAISDAVIDIQEEIKNLKSKISEYENKFKCKEDEDVKVCEERYYNSLGQGSMPSADGFYRPLTWGITTTNFGYSDYHGTIHYGMDISANHGTSVYPVADGRVVQITYKSSCGGNMLFIGHTVNGVSYTSGYYHLATINVKVGQIVSHDDVVATTGGVPWIETWDGCSSGGHLHLQMATGIYMQDYMWYSNFQARSFDPRNLISLPLEGGSFSGR